MAIGAATVWRVRPGGNAANGAGFDATISGAGTDYSQQDTAQATGTLGTAAGTTTFTDAGGGFTSVMVGNAIRIASGAGFTVGYYFVITFNSSTSVVLDRSPGTGSAANWKLGGAGGGSTAHPFEIARDSRSTGDKAVPGNTIYILGSGTAPVSPDYSFGNNFLNPQAAGDSTNGPIKFMVDPSQPTWRPFVSNSGGDLIIANGNSFSVLDGLIFRPTSAGNGRMFDVASDWQFRNCTWNMNDIDTNGANLGFSGTSLINCEGYSKIGSVPTARTSVLFDNGNGFACFIVGCNFHDLGLIAVHSQRNLVLIDSVFDNSVATYLKLDGNNGNFNQLIVRGNTFNKTTADAVVISQAEMLVGLSFFDNIISNNTGAGKYGVNVSGTLAVNDRMKMMLDYNTYFNNTANVNGISLGANDLTLDPQFTTSPGNLTIGTNLKAQGFPRTNIVGNSSEQSYRDTGGLQRQESGGGSTIIVPNINRTIFIGEGAEDAA